MSLYASSARLLPSPRSFTNPNHIRRLSSSASDTRFVSPQPSLPSREAPNHKSNSYACLSLRQQAPSSASSHGRSRSTSLRVPSVRMASLRHFDLANLFAQESHCSATTLMSPPMALPHAMPPSAQGLEKDACSQSLSATAVALQQTSHTAPDTNSLTDTAEYSPAHMTTMTQRMPTYSPVAMPPPRSPLPPISTSPFVCSLHSSSSSSELQSPMARYRRAPSPSDAPPMHILSSPSRHSLTVQLPTSILPDMVTISAKKGDRLDIVADAWHLEENCHYEWQVSFAPRDVDMNSIRARFEKDGHLVIDILRHRRLAFQY